MLSKKSKKVKNSDDELDRDTTDVDGDQRQDLSATALIAAGELTKSSIKKKNKK